MFCLFVTFTLPGAEPTPGERDAVATLLRSLPGLAKSLLHTPSTTSDPYLHDGAPPALVLQLYFAEIAALEAATLPLQALSTALPSLAQATTTQQAMAIRTFPTPNPTFQTPPGEPHCTYLVAYEGPAEDLPAWLAHYIDHHPPIMAKFPNIRQIEICSRVDWTSALPYPRDNQMQRNKVVFDSQAALTAALNSPVRHEMRADFKEFPPFSGGNTHFPMLTLEV